MPHFTQQQLRSQPSRTAMVQQVAGQRQAEAQAKAQQEEYDRQLEEYNQQKAIYDAQTAEQAAYSSVMRAYEKGMLWAVAAYGEGRERQIAKQMIKQGYSSAKGGLLDQERYKEKIAATKELGGGDYKKGLEAKKAGLDEYLKNIKEGYKPVFVKGELTGYQNDKLGKSVLPNFRQIEALRQVDLRTPIKEAYIPINILTALNIKERLNPQTNKPYGTYYPTPNIKQQYKEALAQRKENLPKGLKGLAFIPAAFDVAEGKASSWLDIQGQKQARAGNTPSFNLEQSKAVVDVGTYFTPIVGEVKLASFGAETVARTDTTLGEKGFGVLGVVLGVGGLGLRAYSKFNPSNPANIMRTPKGEIIKIKVVTDTKRTFQNLPKPKILTMNEAKSPRIVKGGTLETQSPINPRVVTEVTSTGDKTFKIVQMSDTKGNVAGVLTRGGQGKGLFAKNLYRVEYKSTGLKDELAYKVFKNDKLIKTFKDTSKPSFGFTQAELIKSTKGRTTQNLPDKSKLLTKGQNKVYSQELVPIAEKNVFVTGELKTTIKTGSQTIATPLKQKSIFRIEPQNIRGELTTKTTTPKFSKSNPPDVEKILGIKQELNKVTAISKAAETPRATSKTIQTLQAEGTFRIERKGAVQRYADSNLWRGKRGSAGQITFERPLRINTERLRQVQEPSLEVGRITKPQEFLITLPSVAKETGIGFAVGSVFKMDTSQKLGYAQRLDVVQRLDLAQRTEYAKKLDVAQRLDFGKKTDFAQRLDLAQRMQLAQKMDTAQRLEQATKQRIEQRMRQQSRPRPEEMFRPVPPIILPALIMESIKFLRKKKKRELYEALTRRRGKEISLGLFESQSGAEARLKNVLEGTLAASGKIKQDNILLTASKLKLFRSGQYRVSKNDGNIIVQLAKYRLARYPEVKEIQEYKKNKSSSSNSWKPKNRKLFKKDKATLKLKKFKKDWFLKWDGYL